MFKSTYDLIKQGIVEAIQKKLSLPDVSTIASAPTTTLTMQGLTDSWRSYKDKEQEYTREVWRDLGMRYGPNILMACTIQTLKIFEQSFELDASCRPAWVKPSVYLPVAANDMIFLRCGCICHEPRTLYSGGQRVLLPSGNWCCTCSAYEDVA